MSISRNYKRLGPGLALLLQLWGFAILAQEGGEVHGRIMDAVTRLPIPFASVFFNNTSIGTIADSLGNYRLTQVPVNDTDLVISSIGYESLISSVSLVAGKELKFDALLSPSKNFLKETMVTGSRDRRWKKQYEEFFKVFMGEGPNASFCEIVNAGILNFRTLENGTFTATAKAPLEIINHALGYKILLVLKRFEMMPDAFTTQFYTQFTELVPKDKKEEFRWGVNRVQTYKGSLRHLLKSIIDKRVQSEGFRVYWQNIATIRSGRKITMRPIDQVALEVLDPLRSPDPNQKDYYQLLQQGTFEIHYLNRYLSKSRRFYPDFQHPVSWLTVRNAFLLCPANGAIKSNSNNLVVGDMGNYRVADVLPQNFDPVPEEGKAYFNRSSQSGTLDGVVIDAANGRPLAGAHVFINNTMHKASADRAGRFEIKNIPPGTYTLVATHGQYQWFIVKVEIEEGKIIHAPVNMSDLYSKEWSGDSMITTGQKRSLLNKLLRPDIFNGAILNPDVAEIKHAANKIQIKTRTPLELEDRTTGYEAHYYLKNAEINPGTNSGYVIEAYISFDTLPARSLSQRARWNERREHVYYGSFNHFARALTKGRSSEEGFRVYTSAVKTPKRKLLRLVNGDSLLVKRDQNTLRLRMPQNAQIRFDNGKPTQVNSDTSLQISSSGVLYSDSHLQLIGPMGKQRIPLLPSDYQPPIESISNPDVWVYVRDHDLSALNLLREKPFLHTDKGYYYPGEKIWYKAYMRYAAQLAKDSLSKVLYVQLINQNKKIVKDKVLKIENGETRGDLSLPDTLKPGNYYLRAYTSWGLNFNNEDIFIQSIPILSTNENLAPEQGTILPVLPQGLSVALLPDRQSYKPREKVTVKVKVNDPGGAIVNCSLSVSVTDAVRIVRTKLTRSILDDSLILGKEIPKLLRISNPIEKTFGYDCRVNSESIGAPTTVVITAITNKQVVYGRPNAESRFRLIADFYDSASFIFRANLKNGNFAGHVTIQRPAPIPVLAPDYQVALTSEHEDIKQRIDYSYDPSQKVTVLDEVLIKSTRIDPPVNLSKPISLLQNPSIAVEGAELNHLTESIQDIDAFMSALANRVAGARYDRENHLFFLRTSGLIGMPGRPTNAAIYVENILFPTVMLINPIEIEKVEIFKNASDVAILGANGSNGIVRFILKKGPDKKDAVDQYDRYALSGFASPSKFYMRDYSTDNNATLPDLRTTIYWDPQVITDDGESTISFYAADARAQYRIVIQGLSDKGDPVYGEQIIKVE